MGIVPTDVDHRTVAAPPSAIIGPIFASACGHAKVPLVERYLAAPDGEGVRDHHPMDRLFIDRIFRTHFEFTARNHDHFSAFRTIAEQLSRLRNGGSRGGRRWRRGRWTGRGRWSLLPCRRRQGGLAF